MRFRSSVASSAGRYAEPNTQPAIVIASTRQSNTEARVTSFVHPAMPPICPLHESPSACRLSSQIRVVQGHERTPDERARREREEERRVAQRNQHLERSDRRCVQDLRHDQQVEVQPPPPQDHGRDTPASPRGLHFAARRSRPTNGTTQFTPRFRTNKAAQPRRSAADVVRRSPRADRCTKSTGTGRSRCTPRSC